MIRHFCEWVHSQLGCSKAPRHFWNYFLQIIFIYKKFNKKIWIVQDKIIVAMVVIFHMCIQLCMTIFFNQHKHKKCQNGALNIQVNMFFLHDNFLHMWPTSKVKKFEPNAHKKLPKWFNKNQSLVSPASKF